MKLLNYKNTHFDRIVHKDHPLLSHSPIEEPGECNIVTQNTTKNQTLTITPNTTNESTNKAPYGETLVKNYPCAHCGNKFEDKTKYYHHCKTDHEDEYITVLEKQLKESEENVHTLVKDLEKVKIENKELKTIRKVPNLTSKVFVEDNYDEEDESELDSERALLHGKESGFRRGSPQVQSVQLFPCKECGHKLKDQYNLDMHLKRHQDNRKRGKECGETFKRENDLDFHTKYEHTNMSQWNCMECFFQATSKDQLKNHMNFKHTNENNKEAYECEVCKRQFRPLWHLKNHTRDEHGGLAIATGCR